MKRELPAHPVLRPDTTDRAIWEEAIVLNPYRLPDLFQYGDKVLDVGAHTGSVSWRCATGGAHVVAVEPSRANFHLLIHNLSPVADRIIPVHAAAWRSDQPACVLRFDLNWQICNWGGGCVLGDGGSVGHDVLAIPLDELLRLHPQWRLLKLDCEASEFPCLYTARELSRVQNIVGEYHERGTDVRPFADVGKPYTMLALKAHLEAQGFAVEIKPAQNPKMGYFFARRS